MEFTGKINLIIGPMFSGKTTTLITRYRKYLISNKKCLMIKYIGDTRYDKLNIVTHDNIKIFAINCNKLDDVKSIHGINVRDYDIICIDEIQFYSDAPELCEEWANYGVIVEACGLNGTFNRKPFDVINNLIPLADNITFLTAVCKHNGNDAPFTKLLCEANPEHQEQNILIGGIELYNAVDRKYYFKK